MNQPNQTNPKIITYIKKEIGQRVEKHKRGDNKMAARMGFGGGFEKENPDPTVFVFSGGINKAGKVEGNFMEHNFFMANMLYGKYGFMDVVKRRLSQGDVYAVVWVGLDSNQNVKLLLIKRDGILFGS